MYKYNPLLENKFSQMSDTLYKDLFSEVYNKLHSELLSNIKLGLSVDKPVVGKVILKKTLVLAIPENEHSIIFHTSLSDIAGIIYTNEISPYYRGQWINNVELMTNNNLTVDIKTIDGIMIPHSSIYIKSSLTNNSVLYVSITLKVLSDLNLDYKQDFYISMYINNISEDKDTIKKNIYSYNYRKNDISDKDTLLDKITNENIDNDYTFIYINGYLYKNNYLDIINNLLETDPLYIDFIQDYNIQKSYTLYDINQFIDDLIYNDINGKPYILLHTPKYLIDNSIYTLDTIDLFIFNNISNQGLFIPSIDSENINQINSSDISISLDYLNTFISKLQNDISDNFNLEIKYRIYNKDNKLDYNSIYTNLLYKYCGDTEIKNFILSKSNDDILNEIYNANELQSSLYTKTLYKLLNKRNYFEIFNMSLNVYNFFIFCQKYCYSFYTIKIEDNNIKSYILEKSLFYKNEFVYLKVYKNKILLDNSEFTFKETFDTIEVIFNNININDLFYIQLIPCDKSYNQIVKSQLLNNLNTDNSIISNIYNKDTFLFDWTNSDYKSFTVDENNNKLIIKFNTDDKNFNYDFYKFDLYLREEIESDEFTYLDKKLPYRYTKIDNLKENDYFEYIENNIPFDKSFSYIFKQNSYGKTFLIVPNSYYTLHIKQNDIEVIDNDILTIDLKYNNDYIVDIPNLTCYLNGYYLYNDIDYKIAEIKNDDNSISGYQLHIQNYYYKNNNNNQIDIYISTIDKLDVMSKKGYGIKNVLISDNKIIYNDNEDLLELFIDGKIYNAENKKILTDMIVVDDFINNIPYEINYIIPSIIQENYYENNILNRDDSYIINKLLQPTSTGPFNTKLDKINSYKKYDVQYTNLNRSIRQVHPYSDLDNALCHLYPYSVIDDFNIFNYLINLPLTDNNDKATEISVYSIDKYYNNENYFSDFLNYLTHIKLESNKNNVMEIDIYNGTPNFLDRTKYIQDDPNYDCYSNFFNYLIQLQLNSDKDSVIEIEIYDGLPNFINRYIYSTYLIYIINKIVNNEFLINCSEDDHDIYKSLSKFEYLKKHDIILSPDNRILNYRYIIYPDINNANRFTSNINKLTMIKKLISIVKPYYITI